MVHSRCKRMLVSPSSLQVSELVPHQASKLSSKHKPVSKHMTPSLMLLICLPMHLLGVLHKELNFYCYCSNPNAENVTWPSLILVASLLGTSSVPQTLTDWSGAAEHPRIVCYQFSPAQSDDVTSHTSRSGRMHQ